MDVRTTHVIYTDEYTIMFGDIRGSVWNLERVNGQERESSLMLNDLMPNYLLEWNEFSARLVSVRVKLSWEYWVVVFAYGLY